MFIAQVQTPSEYYIALPASIRTFEQAELKIGLLRAQYNITAKIFLRGFDAAEGEIEIARLKAEHPFGVFQLT